MVVACCILPYLEQATTTCRITSLLVMDLHFNYTLSLILCDSLVQVALMLKHLHVYVELRLVPDMFIPLGVIGAERQTLLAHYFS